MRQNKFQIYLLSCIIGGGVVMSLINANNGHGISTNEILHESVLAQLNGESPSDDGSDDPGDGTNTGGGTNTGSGTGPVTSSYRRNSLMHYTEYSSIYWSDSYGRIPTHVKNLEYLVPNSQYSVKFREYSCEYSPNENDFCDTSKEGKYIYSYKEINGTGDSNQPSLP